MDVKHTAKPQNLSREFPLLPELKTGLFGGKVKAYHVTSKQQILPLCSCSVHIHLSLLCFDGELKTKHIKKRCEEFPQGFTQPKTVKPHFYKS